MNKTLKNRDGFILGSTGGSSPNITGMPEANGAYVAAPVIYNQHYPFAREIKEKYQATYNKSFSQFAANGYDSIKLIAGLMKGREISRENLRAVLEEGFMYPGVLGFIDVKPGEHEISFPLHPAQIVNGKLKYLK